MALFQQIKELLGLNSGESDTEMPSQNAGETENVAVTVEHEPDTESEDAVKGTRAVATSESRVDTTNAEADGDEPDRSAESDAEGSDASVESDADEPDGAAEVDAAESAESVQTDADEPGDVGTDTSETSVESGASDEHEMTETTDDDSDEATVASASEPSGPASTEDVQSINGIGPAYAERLAEADIETVGELAAADADAVAETTGIALSRVEGWIDQAGE
ncbi:helix-hairpin-helix domain-containing protein [Halorhabdus sp. BNX81]|uniref:helix-hairpin-helix domain-containing protein n=1 Tax=Halorhabdus sp. BNX81 TaxID=2980181 RepID=UPI0023DD52ED|nr:helix-hairpin-helix domain-containing protein [Halorhabdus sp. BNX81]WEL22122.1 Putative nucleic acid binding protein, containing HHH domain [Halorhabdus sp. BNX81]